MNQQWRVEIVHDLPSERAALTIYILKPKTPLEDMLASGLWHEQLKREIGIFTEEELRVLSTCVMLFLGAGGMGAFMALLAARSLVGTIIVSDPDTITLSNVNRQQQTTAENIGEMKVWELGMQIRQITPNTTVVLVPTGITPEIMDMIVSHVGKPDIGFEEIELFEKEARIASHIMLREREVDMINCNAIMFGSYLFLLTKEGKGLVEMLGYSDEAMDVLLRQIREGTVSDEDDAELESRLFLYLIPKLKEYSLERDRFSTVTNWRNAIRERIALVTGTTPATAGAIALLHAKMHILKKKLGANFNRKILTHPLQPGYTYRDFLLPEEDEIVREPWFSFPRINHIGHEH